MGQAVGGVDIAQLHFDVFEFFTRMAHGFNLALVLVQQRNAVDQG